MAYTSSEARAFLGKRVTVDGELLIAHAELTGKTPIQVGKAFGARIAMERDTCHMEWHDKVLGYKCTACGKVMRLPSQHEPSYCPFCGAANIGR